MLALCPETDRPREFRESAAARPPRVGELGRPGRPAPAGDWPEPARGQDAEGGSEGDLEGRPSSEQADDDSDGRTQGPSSGDPHGGAGGDVPRRTWQRGLAVPSQPKDSGREDRGDVRGRSWQRGFATPSQPGEVGYPQRRSEFRSQGHEFEQTGNVRGAGVPTPVDSSIEDPYRFSRLREVAWDRFLLKSESLAAAHRLPPGGSGRVARIVRGLADAMRRKRKRYRGRTRPSARPGGAEVPRQRARPRPGPGAVPVAAPPARAAGFPETAAPADAAAGSTTTMRDAVRQSPTACAATDSGTTVHSDRLSGVTSSAATGRHMPAGFANGTAASGPADVGRFDPAVVARRASRMASAFRGAERARAEIAERRGAPVAGFGGAAWA